MITDLDTGPALIVVDLQQGTLANRMVVPTEPIVERAVELIDAFHSHRLPVAVVTASEMPSGRNDHGSGVRPLPSGWDTLDGAIHVTDGDIRVSKTAWSAFTGTGLDDRLRARGVTTVVIVGLATSFGIESTARSAYDLGYNVVLPVDAMTDTRAESHDYAVTRVFPVIARTGSSADVLELLNQREN